MPKPFVPLSLAEFADRLRAFTFTRPITAVHMHHTWAPRQRDYAGVGTIESMFRYHTQKRGFSDIAQHLSIAPDGTIWTGRDWNQTPASASGFNTGAFMFETIGNFDAGHERLEGIQRQTVTAVIALVQLKCRLPLESLHFHREFTKEKSCPGTGIRKADILAEVRAERNRLVAGTRELLAVGATSDVGATSRYASADGRSDGASRETTMLPFAEGELASAEMPADEAEPDCGTTDTAPVTRDAGASTMRATLSAGDRELLRRHVVNLRQGRFSSDGDFQTSPGDVDAMFGEHLVAALQEAKARGERLQLLFWAHGGLVDEPSGLNYAKTVAPWWVANHVYPIFFVWETGFFQTIKDLLGGRRGELAAARDVFDFSDRILEEVARAAQGDRIWGGMKQSAQLASEDDGGARYVARKLAEFCEAHPGEVELHAVGHSAGSIFHSHFVPAALAEGAPGFATGAFLAPAIRTTEFAKRLAPMLGAGQGIDSLAIFTMKKDLELDDNCGGAYRKSLLYLINRALERKRGEPLLGLEESLRADPALAELFGLGGNEPGAHEVVFSRTQASTGRTASHSRTHGGFDNDRATMESVLRRVLRVADGAAIEPFPEAAARAFSFDAMLEADEPVAEPFVPPPARPAPAVQPKHGVPPVRVEGPSRLARALCIGIDRYPSSPLGGCVADANSWAREFKTLGFAKVDVITDAQATEERIADELRSLVRGASPGDVLAFQYAGHGTFFRDRNGDEPDRQDEAIVPVDFDKGRFLLDDEIFRIVDELPDGAALTIFFDCCHSGSMSRVAVAALASEPGDGAPRPRFIDPTPAMWREYRRRREGMRGVAKRSLRDAEALKAVAFSACRDDEVALERGGHGVFTTHVTPLLRQAYAAGTTNEAFYRQIKARFGPAPSQNPALDCRREAMACPLLRHGVAAMPATKPAAVPGTNGGKRTVEEAMGDIAQSLYTLEPDAFSRLVDEGRRLLEQRQRP